MNLSWPEKYTDVCSLHRAEVRKEGDGRSKNAVSSHPAVRLWRKKTDSSKPFASGSHNLTEKVVPWCKLIYDRVRKDGDIKECTSDGGEGAGSRLGAPKVKVTPERNLHSQLSSDVKWKQLQEAVGGGQEAALTRLYEDSSHFSLPHSLLYPGLTSPVVAAWLVATTVMPMLGCGAWRITDGTVRMNPSEVKAELGLHYP